MVAEKSVQRANNPVDPDTIAEREYAHLRWFIHEALASNHKAGRKALDQLRSYYRSLIRHQRLSEATHDRLCARLDDLDLLERKTAKQHSDRQGPTAESAVKRPARRDPVEALASQGSLSEAQHRAAVQIRDVYYALTKALMPSARDLSGALAGRQKKGAKSVREPADQMPAGLLETERYAYTPWRSWLESLSVADLVQRVDPSARPTRQSQAVTALPVVMDVLIDGQALTTTDRAHGLRNGSAAQCLRGALSEYARLTGVDTGPNVG